MLSDISVIIRGCCRFRATGDFPERFLNLCARSDMGLWDISRDENGITASVIAGRYRKLLAFARRSGIRLKVLNRSGLPFRMMRFRRRPGMPLGFVMFCGMIWFLSLFVWSVELPALSPEVSAKTQAALEDMGVRVGSLRSEMDGNRMSVELQLKVPDLTWAGISTYGSRVTVEAKEFEPVASRPEDGQPRNLVAARDGIILDIEPLLGSMEVKPGEAVVRGDLLVSGVVEYPDGSVQIVSSEAKVWAATTRKLTCSVPFRQLVRSRTGRLITRHRVRLFGLEIPLVLTKELDGLYDREYSDWHMTVGGAELPFEVRTERCYELEERTEIFTQEQAEAMAMEQMEEQIAAIECAEIIERKVTVTPDSGGVTVDVILTVKEDIAAPAKIGIQ